MLEPRRHRAGPGQKRARPGRTVSDLAFVRWAARGSNPEPTD
ncbi:hypothetical protein KCH_42030 [Kitasatospora cheerisanensis KCTC 2395]|uniref:Uncharacterized protein n=1 Tax=Kitasatospora cheerisanensis KCTC 2395 TaxID=1348663 RepID=A0A066YT32_9ACTN|nr:hypothetical protein KCH_42030 [Kitasatospora cheerisanensis KCTC 2395]